MALFKGIFFDLYGTLVDIATREDHEAFRKMALWLSLSGWRMSAEELHDEYIEGCKKLVDEVRNYTDYPEIDVTDVFGEIIGRRSVERVREERLIEAAITFRAFTIEHIATYSWVERVLGRLKERKFLLGIVSNAQRVFSEREMKMLGIYDLFDCVVFSSDLVVRKPDPRIFQKALKCLKLKAREVIFIGNDLMSDVYGAKMLCMKTILVKSNIPSHPFDVEPDLTLRECEMARLHSVIARL